MHGDTPVKNTEQLVPQTYFSILHPDNRKELAHQGFYNLNSNRYYDRNKSGAEKRQCLQKSKSMGAEEKRRAFQKSRALKQWSTIKNNDENDSTSFESDDPESFHLARKSFDLRSFSTDLSDSIESSDSSLSHEPSHASKFKSSIATIRTKQDGIQKLRNDVELLKIGKKKLTSGMLLNSIAEDRRQQIHQIMHDKIDDADYSLATSQSTEPSFCDNTTYSQHDGASVNEEILKKKICELDGFADHAHGINHFSKLIESQTSEIDQMQNKNIAFHENNTMFKFNDTSSLEASDAKMVQSDSDATITVLSPFYLSDTVSDLTILESSIAHEPLSKKERFSRILDSSVVSEPEQMEKRKVLHDENFNIKDQTIHSKSLQQIESDSHAVVNIEAEPLVENATSNDSSPQQPAYCISQVEKVCGCPENELAQDLMPRRNSEQLPRMESAQSDSSGFAEADISADHYPQDSDKVKLDSLGGSAESDKTFCSSMTVLNQSQLHCSSPGEVLIGISNRQVSNAPNIPSVIAEKRQITIYRETLKIPVDNYKACTSEKPYTSLPTQAMRPYSHDKELIPSHLMTLDRLYQKGITMSRMMSDKTGEKYFVSHCHVDVTPRGNFRTNTANNSTMVPPNQDDRSGHLPYIYYPGHFGANNHLHVNQPRIEDEVRYNPDLYSSGVMNHGNVSKIIVDRDSKPNFHKEDTQSHMTRSNTAFITSTADIRKPVGFSISNQSRFLASNYQNNLKPSRFQSRHRSLSQTDCYPRSSSTFLTSVKHRQRSVGNLDSQCIRSPTFAPHVQNKHRSVRSFEFYQGNSSRCSSSLSEIRKLFPATRQDNSLSIPREQFKGSQSSLRSRSDHSHQSCLEKCMCRDEDINYIKLITLVNQPIDAKKHSNSSLSVVHYMSKHRPRMWPTLEKAQHLEEETHLAQCAVQRYKTQIHSMEAMQQNSYQQAFDNLDDDEKEEVEELMILWEDLRREVSEMEQLLAGRMYGVISGNDNFNTMLGLSVIEQLIMMMKEQICQQQLNSQKDSEIQELFPLGHACESRSSTTAVHSIFQQRQLQDELSVLRQTVMQEVRDEIRDKTRIMHLELQCKQNEIQHLQMEILMKNIQDGLVRSQHVLESDI